MQTSIPWHELTSIFLDMDGVVLDKAFDDWFWKELVPQRWAQQNGGSVEEAKTMLLAACQKVENTLAWYDPDYWSAQLGLDIAAMKREQADRIALRTGAVEFLTAVQAAGTPLALITNAHPKTLAVKLSRVNLTPWFSAIISADSLGCAKEEPPFWERLQQRLPFDPERTLFVDDTEQVLASARGGGIEHLLYITKPSSAGAAQFSTEFSGAATLGELVESLPDTTRHRPASPEFT